jgi:hypothetical protein
MTDSQLIVEAEVIKNETAVGANTADRVGQMLEDIIDNKINNDKIDTDGTLAADSDSKVASQKATKTYADAVTAGVMKLAVVQTVTAAKTFSDGTLKVRNANDSASFSIKTDNAAGDDVVRTMPLQLDENGDPIDASFQYVENISNDISADSGSTTKYPSVDAMEDYVAAHSGSLPYKVYSALVSKGGSTFTINELQNDFVGTTFTFTNPLNGVILITASSATFATNKTVYTPITLDGGNVVYGAMDARIGNTTTLYINMIKCSDNSQSATPNFTNQLFEFKVYN